MFHALVEEAPASRIGPLTVLAEVRTRRGRRAKVGGGILAAAVVAGVFALAVPSLLSGNGASDNAAGSANHGMGATTAQDDAGGKVAPEVGPGGSGSSGGPERSAAGSSVPESAAAGTTAAGTTAAGTSAAGGAAGGGNAPDSGQPGVDTESQAGGGVASPPGATASSGDATASAASSGVGTGSDSAGTPLPPLPTALLNAAVAALPQGTVSGVDSVTVSAVGEQRSGAVLHTDWGGSITIVVSAGQGAPSSTTVTDGAGLLATATGNGLTALAVADRTSVAHLTQAQLDAVAAAVVAAVK